MTLKHSFLAFLLPLFVFSCGKSASNLEANSSFDVELLETGSKINEAQLVMTAGSELKTDGFRDAVYSQIKAGFLGFVLTSEQKNSGYAFSGPLKVFSGKYLQQPNLISSPWPRDEFKDQNWQEIRDGVLTTKLLFSDISTNLRIYYFPARAGYANNEFKIEHALLLAQINAKGERRIRLYRDGKLYQIKQPDFPKSFDEVSLFSEMEAGESVKADVTAPNGRIEKNKLIPAKLYSIKTHVPKEVAFDTTILAKILDRHVKSETQDPKDYQTVAATL